MYNSIQTALLVIGILFPILAICSVALRFRARALKRFPIGLDDYTIVLGLIIACMDSFAAVYGVVNAGLGIPNIETDKVKSIAFEKIIFTVTVLWSVGIAVVKVSVLLLYRRLFTTRGFRIAVHILIAITLAWMVANTLVVFLAWAPLSAMWTRKGHTRVDYPAFLISTGVITMVLDIVTLSYPLFIVRSLNMSRQQKVIVAGLFLLGALCVFASIIRLPYWILYLQAIHSVGETHAANLTLVPTIVLWLLIEIDLAVVAACLPTYRPLLREKFLAPIVGRVRSAVSSRSQRSRKSSTNNLTSNSASTNSKQSWMLGVESRHHVSIDHISLEDSSIEENSNVIRKDTHFEITRIDNSEC